MRTAARNAPARMRPATLLLKSKTPCQDVLRLRRRLNGYCASDGAFRWAGGYGHPGKQFTTTSGGYSLPPSRDYPRDSPQGSPQELKSYITGNYLSIRSFCIHGPFLVMTPIKSENALRAMLILEEFGLPMSIVPETGYELYLPLFHPSTSWNGLAKQFSLHISDLQNKNLKKEPPPP